VQVNHRNGGKVFTNTKLHSTHPCLRSLRYDPWTGDVGQQKSYPSLLGDARDMQTIKTPVLVRSNPYLYYAEFM
jgi:hypothetical protein